MYSVLNPIGVNSTLTGTNRREMRGRWQYLGKTKYRDVTQEMYVSGLLEASCINNVSPREEDTVCLATDDMNAASFRDVLYYNHISSI